MKNVVVKILILVLVLPPFFVACTKGVRRMGSETASTGNPSGEKAPTSPTALSQGPGSGNGGKGVRLGDKLYLLDLVEAGVEKQPYFNMSIQVSPEISERVALTFSENEACFPKELISRKLQEIMTFDFSYGLLLLKTMELFQWRVVDLSPTPVNDQREGVQIRADQFVQLAKRLHQQIIFDRKACEQLDLANRAALVFHEINYAYAQPISVKAGYDTQDTGAVQELTALMFSPNLSAKNFDNMIQNLLPAGYRVSTSLVRELGPEKVLLAP